MNSSIFIVQFKEIFNEIRWEISEKKREEETLWLLFAKKMDIVVREAIRINSHSIFIICEKTSRFGKHGDEEWSIITTKILKLLWLGGSFLLAEF